MSGIYLTWLADVLRAAGLVVVDSGYGIDGWETRARSSGGFPELPLGVQWHHTASQTSPPNDIHWQIDGCDDAPVGNMTIMRDGSVWLVAAGAANCAGKGGPLSLSRGTIPLDSGNTRSVAIEVANSGTGENWPIEQINSYFLTSNAINAQLGNRPDDVFTHSLGTGNGWTDRKIDPATANAVSGSWKPRAVNSSGTWSLDDIRAECLARAGQFPSKPIPPNGDDDVEKICVRDIHGFPWVTDFASYANSITEDQAGRGRDMRGYSVDPNTTGPWQLDEQDSDLMQRLANS
jgi:hypothetical protein